MRKTRSWKHNRKDRKQYSFNGKGKVWYDGYGYVMLPINTEKRNTYFMSDCDIEEE